MSFGRDVFFFMVLWSVDCLGDLSLVVKFASAEDRGLGEGEGSAVGRVLALARARLVDRVQRRASVGPGTAVRRWLRANTRPPLK